MSLEDDGCGYEPSTPRVALNFPETVPEQHTFAQWFAEQMLACPQEPDGTGHVWDPYEWRYAVWLNVMEWAFSRGMSSNDFVNVHLEAEGICQKRRASSRWWQLWGV